MSVHVGPKTQDMRARGVAFTLLAAIGVTLLAVCGGYVATAQAAAAAAPTHLTINAIPAIAAHAAGSRTETPNSLAGSLAPSTATRASWKQWGISAAGGLHFWMKVSTDEVVNDVVLYTCVRYAPGWAKTVCSRANSVARSYVGPSWVHGVWIEYYLGGSIKAGIW